MENEEEAKKWLNGRKIRPKDVREKSAYVKAHKKLYNLLSNLSHPNLEALPYYSIELKDIGKAQFYGGYYVPKITGKILCQFLFAQLSFLDVFYDAFNRDLEKHDLLWDKKIDRKAIKDFTWTKFLEGLKKMLLDLDKEYDALPDDGIELSSHILKTLMKQ